MKVLDLLCDRDHAFEGWFGSEQDFQNQCARHLVQCPMCGSPQVRKTLSAPRLNLSGAQAPQQPSVTESSSARLPAVERGPEPTPETRAQLAQLQAAWLKVARQVVAQTEDVGDRFVDQARRMHAGEMPERAIRGQATPEQTAELLEEGVPVMPLLIPDAAKEPLQ